MQVKLENEDMTEEVTKKEENDKQALQAEVLSWRARKALAEMFFR